MSMVSKVRYILDRRQKRNFLILAVIIFIGSFVDLLGVAIIAPIVSIISDEDIIYTNGVYRAIGDLFGISSASEFVVLFIFGVILIYFLKNIYIVGQNYLQVRYVYNNQRRITTKLMSFYLKRPYLYHANTNVAEVQRNITSDVNAVFDALLNIFYVFNESLVCVLLISFLAFEDWVSTLAMGIILTVIMGAFFIVYKKYSTSLGERTRIASALQSKWLLQAFAGVKEVKVSGKEEFFTKNYDKTSLEYANLARKKTFINIIPKPIMEVICIDGLLLVVGIRILAGADIKAFLPILSVFAVAAYRMLPSFNRISQYVGTIMFGKPSVDSVYSDMVSLRKQESEFDKEMRDTYRFEINSNIEVKNLSFGYPTNEEKVLENVSFSIPYKNSVAIIGESGAGKSTLADVILGILPPSEGTIEISGVNVLEHLRPWHNVIGYIPQVIYLMDDTIRNNIAFGVDEKEINEDKIWNAVRDAQLENFIKGLPEGLNTMVGDRGVRLSGGQRQRIGIARALYTNPMFLVLDEATSALDNDTEKAVMEAIDSLHGSRTMLIIAHRLSTIENCDYIYEVKNKKVELKDKEYIFRRNT